MLGLYIHGFDLNTFICDVGRGLGLVCALRKVARGREAATAAWQIGSDYVTLPPY
jgi:hypothetical protein